MKAGRGTPNVSSCFEGALHVPVKTGFSPIGQLYSVYVEDVYNSSNTCCKIIAEIKLYL